MNKIRIHLLTGTVWTESIDVDGDVNGDIMGYIDEYYYENGLPVALYEMSELDDDEIDEMLAINGGEFYIDGISYIETI